MIALRSICLAAACALSAVAAHAAPAGGSAAAELERIVYVDREVATPAPMAETAAHPLYTGLRRGLERYRREFGSLPELEIPAGPTMRQGQAGERISLLRRRLGLASGDRYDAPLAAAVRGWQRTHGLPQDGAADAETIASLNRGSAHYEQIILANLERARRIPIHDRYVLVDAAAAQMWLYEGNIVADSMRVVVGNTAHPTPLMAGLIRYADINPFWSVPPDFVRERMAPRVVAEGAGYLRDRGYEILSDWTETARILDPATIDWQAVADGRAEPRVRQRPGANNSLGEIKFMMPNELGIALHDTPNRSVFARDDRWLSNGCVRVEDVWRLARWLFGETPAAGPRDVERRAHLAEPVPLFLTYMTAAPAADGGIVFRRDVYQRDPALLARLFGGGGGVSSAR